MDDNVAAITTSV